MVLLQLMGCIHAASVGEGILRKIGKIFYNILDYHSLSKGLSVEIEAVKVGIYR
jgi:hypothetical protein